jgi:delta24(24(1))-sterol reductase
LTLLLVAALHLSGVFPLTFLVDNFGRMMATSMLSGDIVALVIYWWGVLSNKQIRMSGNFIYDFFMGSALNPRLGAVDLKLFAEIRASWLQLFLLTSSAALKQYETTGHVTYSMVIMLVAHFLYANACMKGEECVPTTWDIFY